MLPAGDDRARDEEAEQLLTEVAAAQADPDFRLGLSELYLHGDFGERDFVKAYAWTLAAWDAPAGWGYSELFALAEVQQYFEFFLTEAEQITAVEFLERVLLPSEPREYVRGNPFNAGWWGWEDDPIPAHPGEHTFKAAFVDWLHAAGVSSEGVTAILARCPPSDGPSRDEQIERSVFHYYQSTGVKPEVLRDQVAAEKYRAWLEAGHSAE